MTKAKGPNYQLNNGVSMPAFGLGVFNSSPEDTVSAVSTAIDIGYRLIDTAAFYRNEKQVGEGIRQADVSREDLFVTTKLWPSNYGYDQALAAFDRSVGRLGLEYLDLYLVHWPLPSDFESTIDSYRALIRLQEDGRVRAIGVANFGLADLEKLIAQTGHTPAVNQVELNPLFSQPELRKEDARLGVITQAWSPIGGVNRYGTRASKGEVLPDPMSHPTVLGLAEKYSKSPAQIIIRWHIEIGNSVIPKSVHKARIAENAAIFDFTVSPEDISAIDALDTGERAGIDPAVVTASSFPPLQD